MMNAGHRLIVASGLATVMAASACAPVGDSATDPAPSTAASVIAGVEQLPTPCVPVPESLTQRIDAAIRVAEQRDVHISHGFWTVTHGLLGMGKDLMLHDPTTNERVSALDAICNGRPIRGMRFIPTEHGVDVQNGPIFVGQGHVDQFVAEMVQIGLPPDRTFIVEGREYTFLDFIRQSQARARVTADQELSWSIIAIGQCLGTDIAWTNSFGESLTFEDLVRYELDQDVEQAACGGTHRLFGLCWAYQLHLRNGGQEVGVWKEVADTMATYQKRACDLQNADGSFSTESFRGPGNDPDMKVRLSTTGHILEWLALSLSDAQLQEAWVRRAASALALMILEIQDAPMEGGTLYHAVHALRLYAARLAD